MFTRTVTDIMPYLNEQCRVYNYYGPAECTESAIEHLITKDDFTNRSVPLGRPMANARVYLLDEYLQLVIPGVHVGEIVIGGMIFFFNDKANHFRKYYETWFSFYYIAL